MCTQQIVVAKLSPVTLEYTSKTLINTETINRKKREYLTTEYIRVNFIARWHSVASQKVVDLNEGYLHNKSYKTFQIRVQQNRL